MDKNEVRQLIMNRRHELSDEDIEMQSELIIDRLKKNRTYIRHRKMYFCI